MTEIIGEIYDFFKTLLVELWEGIWKIIMFLVQNFKYNDTKQLLGLFFLLFFFYLALFYLYDTGQGFGIGTGYAIQDLEGTPGIGALASVGQGIGGGTTGNQTGNQTDGQDEEPEQALCQNHNCDKFKTAAHRYFENSASDESLCSDKYVYYNIPASCFKVGTGDILTTDMGIVTIGNANSITKVEHAVCGTANLISRMSSMCSMDENGSIWYIENSINCPADCETNDSCEMDLTCLNQPNGGWLFCNTQMNNNAHIYTSSLWLDCCPAGTTHADKCVPSSLTNFYNDIVSEYCNTPYHAGWPYIVPEITERYISESVISLKNAPVQCGCYASTDCIGDYGSTTCCQTGFYDNSCVTPEWCNA